MSEVKINKNSTASKFLQGTQKLQFRNNQTRNK